MNREQFRELGRNGSIHIPKQQSVNSVNSDTDPTQNVSVQSVYNAMINGTPLDVAQNRMQFNGLRSEDLCSIDKKNNDTFDVFNESRKVHKDFDKKVKKVINSQKQKENEK